MRFEIGLVKRFALALAMVVTAGDALAAAVAPLNFKGVDAGDQQNYWNHLMRFKLWGTNGISSGRMSMPDSSGWTGTAEGGFVGENNKIVLGGPVIIGGDLSMHMDANLSTGPIRSTGKFSSMERGSYMGTVCAEGGIDDQARSGAKGIVRTGTSAKSGDCADTKVAFVKTDLSVPGINPAKSYDGVINVNGSRTITVPPGTDDRDVYDLYLKSINFGNESTLYINMPEGGRLTRIFLEEGIYFGTHPSIQVQYEGSTVANSEYSGNLLFYSPTDITFQNTDNTPIQGTFISTGTIKIVSNMIFAGQILANKLEIGNEIDGSSFIYVPFDSPKLNIVSSNGTFKENDTWVEVPIKLDSAAKVDVSFKYCYQFAPSYYVGDDAARQDDFNPGDMYHKFPICTMKDEGAGIVDTSKTDYATVKILLGTKEPTAETKVWINAKLDDTVEELESFRIVVFDMVGAVTVDNKRQSYYTLYVEDSELEPTSNNAAFGAVEDSVFTLTPSLFDYESKFNEQYGVVITSLPSKGTLTVGGTVLKSADIPEGGLVVKLDTLKDEEDNITGIVFHDAIVYQGAKDGCNLVGSKFCDDAASYSSFTFKVIDSSNRMSKDDYTMTVTVAPRNDAPTVDNPTVTFKEGSTTGATGSTKITVKDVDDNTFAYAFDDSHANYERVNALYEINSTTGVISVKKGVTLDYETADSVLAIVVKVTDAAVTTSGVGKATAKSTVTLKIIDVNEPPVIPDDGKDHYDVNEHSKKGFVVTKIEFRDEDNADAKVSDFVPTLTDNKKVSGKVSAEDLFALSIEKDADGKFFIVVSVKDSAKLNYEDLATKINAKSFPYDVTISLKDQAGATGCNEVSIDRKLNVIDINETPSTEDASFNPKENVAAGTVIGSIKASDLDVKDTDFGTLYFSIVENSNGDSDDDVPFTIDDKGVIKVAEGATLNYEKQPVYEFDVEVTDKVAAPVISHVVITLENVNEDPKISCLEDDKNCEGPFEIAENSATGTVIHSFAVYDDDKDSKFAISKVVLTDTKGTDAASLFDVVFNDDKTQISIIVKDKSLLDYEKVNASYTVKIKVSDAADAADSITRVINVIDVNEAPTAKPFSKEIAENLPTGSVVGTVEASDPDTKNATYSKLTYSIPVNEDASTANDVPFTINASTGVITVKDGSKLDYETNPSFTFKVEVKDIEYTATSTVTITLSDEEEPPEIIEDDPKCDEEKEDCHKCDATIQDCGKPVEPPVECTENCGYMKGDTVYVNVRENSKTGTKILEYYVKDQDAGDLESMEVTFENKNKSGADSLFAITKKLDKDADGDYKFVLSVKDSAKLNYEKINEVHRLLIIVKDDGGKADSILRVIKVVDVNEAPTIKDNLKGKVDENSKVGVVAATMSASDPDIKHPEIYGKLTYTVVEEGTPFKMDSNKVVVADGSMLNYEKDSLYTIHVRVTDGEFAATALVQIKLNNTNEEPFIKCLEDDDNCEGPYDIAENSATGTEIHTFAVMDDDKDPAYRLNSASISDMQGTNARDLFAIKFNVDSSQVTVYVKDGSKLDYEKVQPSYTVKIKISDAMGVADSVIRVINVIDVNEAPSIADSSFAVAENTKNGTVIGSLRASDPDIKNVLFSSLSYEIVDEVPFKMDSNKIVVADSKSLNYEKVTEFYFDVRVTDGGNLTDLATVYVKLNNVDEPPQIDTIPPCDPEVEVCHACDATIEDCDNEDDPPPPTCTENCGYMKGDTVYVNVREDAPAGTKILEYYVNDEDAGDLETMKVTFVDNNKSGSDTLFTITPTLVKDEKGYKFVLTVTDSVDYETTKHSHQMTIIVEDAAGLKDSVFRVINIVDVNEPPYIVKADFDLKEHNKEGATVGTIEWGDDRDMDGVSNPAFRDNRVVAVDGATDIFDVDSLGVITVKKTLNYETDDSTYTLIVSVVDKTDPTLKSTETMTIHLKNIPETPVITSTEFSVDENPADRKVIGTLTSEDLDDLKNEETRTYTLIGTSEFVKVTENGEIVVINKDKFDYETVDSFTIKVKVTDPQGVSSDTTVTIKINDVNEAPNLDDKPITVSEHTAPGTVIDTLKATDPDKDPTKRELTYTIVDGDTSLFEIDSKTGVITLKDSLDYEKAKEHILKVEVSDGEFADIAKITVNVENVEEKSVVEIQMVDDGDSLWVRPDSVYTNRTDVTICWTEDGRDYCSDTTMTEGIHTIIKTFKDPKKDFPGADTVVIQISTSAPQVIVSAKADGLSDGSIFTLDEGVLAGDTNIYVNDSKNDIQVTIKDPVNKKDSTFTVKLDLETVDVSDKDLESVSNIAEKGKLTLNENPKIPASRTPVNGSEVKVFYTEEVDGKKVEVSYYTDKNGDVLKTPVIIDGKVDSIEVITVSYETKIGGRDVVVSYQADAITGQVLNVSSDGMLTYDDKIVVESVPDGKPSAKDTTVSNTTEVSVGSYKVTYEYEDEKHNTIVVTYTVDEKGNIVKNGDGDIGYKVSYTYENKFGNSATQSVFIVLDQKPPVVKIVSPEYGSKIRANSVEVVWTVNGVVQDTLTLQGLKKGFQWIKREYRDKAGNTAVDSVAVQVKDAKSMEIEVVEAVTEMNVEKVEEYYASNPPKKGETFAVSVANPSTGKEVEALTGGSYGQEDGTFKTPYPGVEGNGHLGPTLAMEVRLPVVNDVAGLATFDDLILSDGTISSRGVNSDRCKMAEEYEAMGLDVDSLVKDTSVCVKFTQEQYVEKYCEDDVDLTGDLSKINLYSTRMHAKVWIYTSIGGFVDYYNFKVDLNDPDYTDNAGVLNMYFEQKPDKNGEIHTEDGRVMATGAYLYKVEADIRAKLRCSLPPFDEVSSTNKKKGSVVKKSDELLKPFGYKRPSKK